MFDESLFSMFKNDCKPTLLWCLEIDSRGENAGLFISVQVYKKTKLFSQQSDDLFSENDIRREFFFL